jgi:hypothetical protein
MYTQCLFLAALAFSALLASAPEQRDAATRGVQIVERSQGEFLRALVNEAGAGRATQAESSVEVSFAKRAIAKPDRLARGARVRSLVWPRNRRKILSGSVDGGVSQMSLMMTGR